MDPEETLRRMRRLASLLVDPEAPPEVGDEYAEDLAELVIALDNWLSKGGFLPKDWSR